MVWWETQLFILSFAGYFCAGCLYLGNLICLKTRLAYRATQVTAAAFLLTTAALVIRTIGSGHLPMANMYEFGMTFVWGTVLLYLYLEHRCQSRALGAFVLPVVFFLTALFAVFYQEGKPLMPALKSGWLTVHVLTAVIAYGALALSFALALMYRWRCRLETDNQAGALQEILPALETLERLTNQAIVFAVPFLTLLILTGAVWAEYAWGSYWRWDPKETWSLITWCIYAVYLHGRTVLGWRGKQAMNWAIAGFLAVLFTFVGVNLLLPGLHSYAS